MKNSLFKKSMSVFLAVLMVLSCWVWLPGEHNHASALSKDVELSALAAISNGSGSRADSGKIVICSDGEAGNTTVGNARFSLASIPENVSKVTLNLSTGNHGGTLVSGASVKVFLIDPSKCQATSIGHAVNNIASVYGSNYNAQQGVTNAYNYYGVTESQALYTFSQNSSSHSIDVTNAVNTARANGWSDLCFAFIMPAIYNDGNGNSWSDTHINVSGTNLTVEYEPVGMYYIRYVVNVTSVSNNEKDYNLFVSYKTNNGKGNLVENEVLFDKDSISMGNTDDYVLYEGYINGFPTELYQHMAFPYNTNNERQENFRMYIGSGPDNLTSYSLLATSGNSFTYKNSAQNNHMPVQPGFDPYQNSISGMSSLSVTVDKNGQGQSLVTTGTVYDQYGVVWYQAPTYTVSSSSTSQVNVSGISAVASGKGAYVKVTDPAALFTSANGYVASTGKLTLYLRATSGSASASVPIVITAPKYDVAFNTADGSTAVATKTYNYGQALGNSLPVSSKTGYTFNGWFADGNGNITLDSGEDVTDGAGNVRSDLITFGITQDWLLYSDWTVNEYNVMFDNLIDFSKWDKNAVNNGTISGVTDTGFTLTCNADKGEGTSESPYFTVEPGKDYFIQIDAEGTAWDVYIFFCDENGNWVDFNDGPTNRFSNDTTWDHVFTAPNKPEVVKAKIRLDANGGGTAVKFNNIRVYEDNGVTVTGANKTVTFDSAYGELPTATRPGYTFYGWTDANGNSVSAETIVKTAENHTLYSKWTPVEYTLTYNTDGGSMSEATTRTYTIDESFTLPVPTKAGHTFIGWKVTSAGGNWVEDGVCNGGESVAKMYGNVTLTAQWDINSYTVTWKFADGTEKTETYAYGTTITAPANSTKASDATNHYTYTWSPAVATTVTGNATYTEVLTTTAHNWGEWKTTSNATCTAEGSKTRSCTVCGYTETAAIGVIAHTEEIIPAVPATCTVPGKTEGKKCSACGEILVAQQDTELAAHTEEILPAVEATCTATGLTEGKKCSVCGEILVAQTETSKLGHDWDEGTVTKEPTCEETGTITHTCKNDSTHTVDSIIDPTGHNFTGTIRNDADVKDGTHSYLCVNGCNTYGGATAHVWNDGEIKEGDEATCLNAGTKTYTCTTENCGGTYTEEVAQLDHNYTNPVITRPVQNADGTWTDGKYTYTCSNGCGGTMEEVAKRADYTELEEAVEALEALKENEKLTADAEAEIDNALTKAGELANDLVTSEQTKIDELVKELLKAKADVEEILANVGKPQPIVNANSGLKVQFLEQTGAGVVESIQLKAGGGFDPIRLKLTNNNATLPITVTSVAADKANIGSVGVNGTVIAVNGSTDLNITAPAGFNETGIITYTITYKVGSDATGFLMDESGEAVVFTTKAYIYVKGEAYTPYHFMDERAAWPLTATSKWQHYFEAVNYGDFGLISYNSASKFSDNLQVGTSNFGFRHDAYDYAEDGCQAGCENGSYTTGDAHAATYRYYVDTSLAPTWEAAGFRVRITESAESVYQNAPLKYVRLAVDQSYLNGIKGSDKTFTTTFIPSASSNVPNKTWIVTSTGTLEVAVYENPDRSEYLFGEHKNTNSFDETSVYVNFSGAIPVGVTEAKMMFSPRIEFNGKTSSESVTMTSHIWLTSYDKGALRAAINEAEAAAYNPDYYDTEKFEAYKNALKAAKEALGKAETTQAEVDEAAEALNDAIDGLTRAEYVLTVTHNIRENADMTADPEVKTVYYLLEKDTTFTVPYDAVKEDTSKINKYDDEETLTITDTAEHTYNYWYIDYSEVQDALDAAQEILDNSDKYDEEFVQKVEDAKNALEEIKNNTETDTDEPKTQVTIDDAVKAVTDLTEHQCVGGEAVIENNVAPDCVNDGSYDTVVYCSVCGEELSRVETIVPAINHDWEETTYNFAADGSSCTAQRVCKNDASHVENATATITSEITTPATCEGKGTTTYTATFTVDWAKTQTKDVVDIPAKDHAWSVEYNFAADGKSCTATRVCANDATHNVTATATITSEVTDPATCEGMGTTTYTATFDVDWAETKTKDVVDIPAKDHAWSVTYNFEADGKSCTAERVCERADCGAKETATATITSAEKTPATCEGKGTTTYTATFDVDWAKTQTKDVVDIPAKNHAWSVTYNFANDGKSCTATRVCANDAKHNVTATATITSAVKTPATCTEKGWTTYTATFTETWATEQTKDVQDIPAKDHAWSVTYNFAADGKSCTATRVCANDAKHNVTATATITSAEKTPATCEEMGTTTYTATFDVDWAETKTKDVVDIPAKDHAWSVTYNFAADGKTCTATRVCANDASHNVTATAKITSAVKTPATCEGMGTTTYTATFDVDWAETKTKDVVDIPAKDHAWSVEYNFADDGKSCTATRVCANDAKHNVTVDATITSEVTDPATCEGKGTTTYTATFDVDWAETKTKDVVDIPAKDHAWSVEYNFADDGKSCTATRVCANDAKHNVTVDATITSEVTDPATCEGKGTTTYTATFDVDWAETKTKDVVDIPAINHDWSVTYNFAADGKSCTATRECANDATHNVTVDATITSEVTDPATCEGMGTTTYTATFTETWATEQTKDVQDIPAIKHAWSVTYNFADDGKSCTATRVCANDAKHNVTVEAEITSTVKTPATCTVDGWTTYTATFDKDWADEQTLDVQDIPAINHAWSVTYNFADDGKSCTATRVCANDAKHNVTVEAEITSTVKTPATCTVDGWTTYTATFDKDWADEQTLDVQDIDALNHDYDTTKSEDNLTRPEFVDGAWTQGYYTFTCKNNSEHKITEKVDRADYDAYDSAVKNLEELLKTDITDEAKATIENALTDNKLDENLIATEQETVDNAAAALEQVFKDNAGALKTYTVTFVVEGETVKTETVISGNAATAPADPSKDYDDTYHYIFAGWDEAFTSVTSDLTVTAEFTPAVHDMGDWEVTAKASCTEDGSKRQDCSACDHFVTETIAKREHVYTDNGVQTAATCKAEGVMNTICTNVETDTHKACTHESTRVIPVDPNAHKWETEYTVDKKASCDKVGSKSYHCEYCDAINVDSVVEIAKREHNLVDTTVALAPTCSATGIMNQKCDCVETAEYEACDYTTTRVMDKVEDAHKWETEYTVDKKASCDAAGSKSYHCEYCDAINGDSVVEIAKRDHNLVDTTVALAPTCSATGIMNQKCDCEETAEYEACTYVTTRVIPKDANAHNWAEATYNFAADGKSCTAERVCTYDAAHIETATAKEITSKEKTAATCTVDGWTTYTATFNEGWAETQTKDVQDLKAPGHTWGKPVLTTVPKADAKGVYTETCTVCGATQTTEVGLADYSKLNTVVGKLENLLNTENLTEEAKQEIEDALADADGLNKNLPADVTTNGDQFVEGGQNEIDALVTELEKVVTDTNADIDDGSALKPDYEAWEEAETAYDALNKANVKDEIITEANALKAEIAEKQADDNLTQKTATQDEIDAAATRLNEIIAGINDGSLRDPDYSAVEDKINDANANDNLNKDTQDKIKDIEDKLQEIKDRTEPEANAKDDQDEVKELEDQLDDILAGIDDGSALKPDYTAAEEAINNAENTESITDEDKATLEDLKEQLEEIKNKVNPSANAKDDQDDVNAIKEAVQSIIDKYADCESGNHAETGAVTKKATCEADGVMTYTCSVCGDTRTEVIAKRDHVYVDNGVQTAATCKAEGVMNTICSNAETDTHAACTHESTRVIPVDPDAHKAEADYTVMQKATCEADGYKAILCEYCDAELSTEVIAKREHVYIDNGVKTAATCKAEGVMNTICSNVETDTHAACTHESTRVIAINPNNHDGETYIKDEDIVPGTCISEKTWNEVTYCSDCNAKLSTEAKTGSIDKDNHDGETYTKNEDIVPGTCISEKTWNEVTYCSDCNAELSTEAKTGSIDKNNHVGETYTKDEDIVLGTCISEKTWNEVTYCSDCNAKLGTEAKTGSIDKNNHVGETYTKDEDIVLGTCISEKTWNEVTYCADCDAKLGTVAKTGAIDENNHVEIVQVDAKTPTCEDFGWEAYEHCTKCDYTTYEEISALGHEYTSKITTAPTCTEKGVKTFTCKNDASHTYTEEIAANGHTLIQVEAKTPTCKEEGHEAYEYCTECDYTTFKAIGKTEHSYKAEVVEPTCTEDGCTLYTCENCGDSYKDDVVSATGEHKWGDRQYVEGDCINGVHYVRYCEYKNCTAEDHEYGVTNSKHVIPTGENGELLWTVSEATCEHAKFYTYGCALCTKEVKVIEGEALGHNWELQPNSRPATCGMAGFNEYHCDRCGGTKREDLPKLGHNMVSGADKAPTCSEDGYTNYRQCLNCGMELYDVVEKTGHKDSNNDGFCDSCNSEYKGGGCGCFCHSNNWFIRIIYAIIRFIWKIFGIHRECYCGAFHF